MMAWRSKDRALSTYCPLELVRVREHKAGAAHRRRTFRMLARVGRVRLRKRATFTSRILTEPLRRGFYP
jgi:hypothetical protein